MVWSVSFGLLALVETPQLRFVVTNMLVLTIPTAAICYFIFCYEFTFKTKPPQALFGLFVPPLLLFVATWFNPENLVYTMVDPHLTDEILIPANEGSIRPLVTVGMGYTLVVMAAGMVFGEMLRSTQRARKQQAAVILLSMLIISCLGAVKVLGAVPPYFDPTPIGWTLSGLLFVATITRHQFLQQSPAPWRQTVATISEAILVLDADTVVADVNNRATEIFDISLGMTGEELRDRNPALSTVLEDTEAAMIELRADGRTRFFDPHTSTLEYGRGATGTVISFQEVTEREAAEQALEMTKERYRRIFQQSSDYVTIVDESKTVVDVTQGVEQILGYEPEAIIGRKVFSYVHPEDKQRAVEAFSKVASNPDRELDVEFRVRAANGEYRWLEGRGSNHLEDPLINGILVNVRNISDRKERERELEALTTRLELALEGDRYRRLGVGSVDRRDRLGQGLRAAVRPRSRRVPRHLRRIHPARC
jgi:PAS domain S-box